MRRKTWRLPCIALTIGLMLGMPVSADEIIVSDPDSLTETAGTAEGDGSIDGIEDNGMGIGDAAADGDLSGLFVETGEEVISRKGETIDDARMADEERTGSGDGGSTVAIGHLYEINGVLVRNSDFPSAHYECWTYANNVYAKIWGHNFWNLFNDTENMLRNLPDEELTLTPEHLKAYVSAAPAGAALRVCDAQYLHADDGLAGGTARSSFPMMKMDLRCSRAAWQRGRTAERLTIPGPASAIRAGPESTITSSILSGRGLHRIRRAQQEEMRWIWGRQGRRR